jgi:hypothetical protein
MTRRMGFAAALLVAAAARAAAQVCTGHESATFGGSRFGAALASHSAAGSDYTAKRLGVEYDRMSSGGVFGGASLLRESAPELDRNSTYLGLRAGRDRPVNAFQVCPNLSLEFRVPDGYGYYTKRYTESRIHAGVAASRTYGSEAPYTPSVGLSFGRYAYKFLYEDNSSTAEAFLYGNLELAVGFTLRGRYVVRPSYSREFGIDAPLNALGLSGAILFGAPPFSRTARPASPTSGSTGTAPAPSPVVQQAATAAAKPAVVAPGSATDGPMTVTSLGAANPRRWNAALGNVKLTEGELFTRAGMPAEALATRAYERRTNVLWTVGLAFLITPQIINLAVGADEIGESPLGLGDYMVFLGIGAAFDIRAFMRQRNNAHAFDVAKRAADQYNARARP